MGTKIQLTDIEFINKLDKFLFLDYFKGANYAFSVSRKLTVDYTGPALLVRRSTDNEHTTVGFNSDDVLDENALTEFASGGDVFVVDLYDQVGNTKFGQDQITQQPQIVSGGAVIKKNGVPSISFDGVSQHLIHMKLDGSIIYDQFMDVPAITVASVQSFNQKPSGLGTALWFTLDRGTGINILRFSLRSKLENNSIGISTRRIFEDAPTVAEGHLEYGILHQVLGEALFEKGLAKIDIDDRFKQEKSLPSFGNSENVISTTPSKIGKAHFEDSYLDGHFSEFVSFATERMDRKSISKNQMNFYNIL